MSKYMAEAMPLCQVQAVCFRWGIFPSTTFQYIPSTVLLTCVKTDTPVPEPQIPNVCIAAAAASMIDQINKTDQRAVPEAE